MKLLIQIVLIIQVSWVATVPGLSQQILTDDKELQYKELIKDINELASASRFEEAIQLINSYKDIYYSQWFELSKEEIYLNTKCGKPAENIPIFREAHKKGYFYLIHPNLPQYQSYTHNDAFDSIVNADQQLREQALKNSRTLYEVVLPKNYSPSVKYPLFIILHGGGSNFEKTKKHWSSSKLKSKFIKVYLQSYRHYDSKTYGWRSGDKRADQDLIQIYQQLLSKYAVDTTQTILAGISAGATYAVDVAVRRVLPTSGIILICPGIPKFFENHSNLLSFQQTLKAYVVSGEKDYSFEKQCQLIKIFDSIGIAYQHIIIEDMGHQFPVDERKHIKHGIKFISAKK